MQAVFSYWQSFLSVSYSRCRQAWVLSITFLQSISFRPVYLHVNMTDIHSATDVWSGHICNWSCPECPDNSNHQMLHCNKFLKLLFFIFTKTLKPKLATADHQSKVRDQRPSIYVIPGNEWSWSVWNCGCSRSRGFVPEGNWIPMALVLLVPGSAQQDMTPLIIIPNNTHLVIPSHNPL